MGWAENKLKQLEERRREEQKESERETQIRSQIMAEAPLMWEQIGEALSREAAKFSESRPGQLAVSNASGPPDTLCKLITAPNLVINLRFYRNVPRIEYTGHTSGGRISTSLTGTLSFELDRNGVRLVRTSPAQLEPDNRRYDAESAAGLLLDLAVE